MRTTLKKVKTAIQNLINEGVTPNVDTIHQSLGNDANRETIQKYFDQWQSEQPTSNKEEAVVAVVEDETQEKTKELEKSLSLVRATLESTTDGILVVSNEGQMVDFNQKFMDMWNLPEEIIASGDEMKTLEYGLTQVENPEELLNEITNVQDDLEMRAELGEVRFKDGRIFERYSQPHRIGDKIVGRVWSFRDVTERRRAEEALRLRDRAIEASTQGIIISDITQSHQPILYVNPAFERITGYSANEAVGRNCNFLQGSENDQSGLLKAQLAIRELREEEIQLKNFKKDGTVFWSEEHLAPVPNAKGEPAYYVRIITDITERREMEQQLLHQATHDSLTDLPNRSLLLDRIEQSIIRARRDKKKVALLFLDLDKFKLVNDSLGHSIGDGLIREVSGRLMGCIRESDTVARLGGDEFITIFSSLTTQDDIIPLTEKIMKKIEEPYYIDGHEMHISTSIGISFYPDDGNDAETLIRNADMSMYQAKDAGRNNYKFFTHEMNQRIAQQMKLETSIHGALDRNEFLLHYQPLLDIQGENTKIIGVEALIRWEHPEHGMISPLEFIPLAEDTGKIITIGEWVLKTACLQGKNWEKLGIDPIRVSVNISARQFKQPDIIDIIERVLKETKLNPEHLELELTETMLIDQVENTIKTLHALKNMGIKIAIDDFGTGYSSLNYLKRFPVDTLKIDRSFIRDIPTDTNDSAITLSIIRLAHSLNLKVLAEGVELQSQLQFLKENGCDEVQGFLFSKPVSANECTKLLIKPKK